LAKVSGQGELEESGIEDRRTNSGENTRLELQLTGDGSLPMERRGCFRLELIFMPDTFD
jgi:hypothetical protein